MRELQRLGIARLIVSSNNACVFVVLNYCMALTKISSYLKVGVILEANIRLYTVADFKISQYFGVYGFMSFIQLIKLIILDLSTFMTRRRNQKWIVAC